MTETSTNAATGMTPDELAAELVKQPDYRYYGVGYIQTLVEGYVDDLKDESLYATETGRLSEEGAAAVRDRFGRDYVNDEHGREDDREDVREDVRVVTKRINDKQREMNHLIDERDGLIRKGLFIGVRVADLADDSALKPARIYQIRDNRR